MTALHDKYELVVGLEVHAQLLTKTKLFSGDSAVFGAAPNTHISPITLGHPGTLPRLNRKAVEYAVKIGLASGCAITNSNYFARKNYFYPDLPKGYQISQHTTPICVGGYVEIKLNDNRRKVSLNRIHLEEDAGKSIHDIDPDFSCVDYNRAGVALIEIVTEPDIYSSEEASAFLNELRKRLRYLDICDGNMEEGSMRCDANISVRLKGDKTLGTKVEVKNLNSIRNVRKAIEFEFERMTSILEEGGKIIQQTRSFDASNGTTFALRSKEEANDYRYFPDPDLPPFIVTEEMITSIRNSLPQLPEQRMERYVLEYQLSEYDAAVICDEKEQADYFEEILKQTSNYKAAANWITGPLRACMNEKNVGIRETGISPSGIAEIIKLVESGKISFSAGSTRLFPQMVNDPGKSADQLARELNLFQDSDEQTVSDWVDQVLNRMPEKVNEYRKGKKGLMGLFVGEVKKVSKGKADPRLTNDILLKKLELK